MNIPQTILQQLGGNKFIAMTGAKHLAGHPDALSFKLPARFAKDNINWVKITLTPMDVYHVEFGRILPGNYRKGTMPSLKMIDTVDNVYCDNLQDVFTDRTGLDTHL